MAPPNQEHLAGMANMDLDFSTSEGSLLRYDPLGTSMRSVTTALTATTFADPGEHMVAAPAAAPVDAAPPPRPVGSVSASPGDASPTSCETDPNIQVFISDDASNVSSLAGTAERGKHLVGNSSGGGGGGGGSGSGSTAKAKADRTSKKPSSSRAKPAAASSRVKSATSRPHHDPERRTSHPPEKEKAGADPVSVGGGGGDRGKTASYIEFSRPGLGPKQGSSIRFHESVNLTPGTSAMNFMDKFPLPNAVAVEEDDRGGGGGGTGELVASRKPRLPSLIKSPKYKSSIPPPRPPAPDDEDDFDFGTLDMPTTHKTGVKARPVGGYNPHGSVSRRSVARWDLTGKGALDEIEYAMRSRDVDGDGTLSKAEVKAIILEQLADQREYRTYCRASCWLLAMVALLAVSNLGTSLAAVALAKDTRADGPSGAVLSKATDEIVAMQVISYRYELEELSDAEFEERRSLVEGEMESDPEHGDHLHRRLGRRNAKNRCGCTKVAYDQGRVRERDLHEMAVRCDGVNTVSIERKWTDSIGGSDYSSSRDVDTLCGPGTKVVRKGRKVKKTKRTIDINVEEVRVKNKKKGNCRKCQQDDDNDELVLVEEQVIFKQRDGREVSFNCGRGGSCYGSGGTLLQGEGHPCHLHRDYDGAGECDDGLVCRDALDPRARRGTGECTRLRSYALGGMACDVDLGVDACESGYACRASAADVYVYVGNGRTKIAARRQKVGVVRSGTCVGIEQRAYRDDTCDASLGDRACDDGYYCLGSNGIELGGRGYGVCTSISVNARPGGVCDRSFGVDACGRNYYCGGGGGGRYGRELEDHGADEEVGADEVESEKARDGGQKRDLLAMLSVGGGGGMMTSRSVGYGRCVRTVGVGGKCFDHESCGWNRNQGTPYQCVGLDMLNFGAVTLDGPADGDRGTFGFCG